MKPFDSTKYVETNAKFEKAFEVERDDWNNRIEELIQLIKRTDKLTDAMVLALSYRQQVVEKLAKYRQSLYKRKSDLDVLRAARYRQYCIEGDIKFTASEKNDAVNADLTAVNYQLNLIQNQIDYMEGTNKTLTDLQYSIKNKITIVTEQLM